ncbi:MAG: Gfo/Idh/MocA family oxidoreductase [Acidobacteria bacterium]|nr:Gfo/Idh/MocA family oxidoreductase [Acidobacteriota bacterium]MBV9625165.1 Gfo/Idh/MocA family oxidoreductase [Acidobacteriota bacterium]
MGHLYSRRDFLGLGAAAAGASLAAPGVFLDPLPLAAMPQGTAASDRVRFGMVGVGMQGNGLLARAIQLPGVECAAACDLYDGRHALAQEIVNSTLPVTRHYKDLLDNKEIDCIIAAVPDHWHKQVVVDAVSAGKDIYCEKPMSHTPADGLEMVAAEKKSERIVQIGSQRVSSALLTKARELVRDGAVGDLMMVEAVLGRNDPNGAWEYPPPPDLSPQNLDWDTWQGNVPKRAFDPNLFARWRCWKEYGTGVAGDLLVHLISGMLYVLSISEPPRRAMAAGGILRWNDGRNMPDVHNTIFEYGKIPVVMRLNLGTEIPESYRFMGSKGLLDISSEQLILTPQSGKDEAPSWYANSFPRPLREAYAKNWHEQHDPALGHEPIRQASIFRSVDYNEVKPHLWNFFQAVKTRQPVVENAVFGHNAALACHMANESYFRHSAVYWDEHSKMIKS